MWLRVEIAFEKSCASLEDLPVDGRPEVALIGRSNVGKSSLLNALAGQHQLARVSRTPGRTRLLNLFIADGGRLRMVDCPGYGYARAAQGERAQWGQLVEAYLSRRDCLGSVLLLVDGRLEPQRSDLEMADWLRRQGRTIELVATKWDRLSGNQQPAALRRFAAAFVTVPLVCSAHSGAGILALQRRLRNGRG